MLFFCEIACRAKLRAPPLHQALRVPNWAPAPSEIAQTLRGWAVRKRPKQSVAEGLGRSTTVAPSTVYKPWVFDDELGKTLMLKAKACPSIDLHEISPSTQRSSVWAILEATGPRFDLCQRALGLGCGD